MQVPTDWIYNFDDPVTLMQDWDTGMDIMNAFVFAKNWIPFGRMNPLGVSQMPLINDPKNWASSWGFNLSSKL